MILDSRNENQVRTTLKTVILRHLNIHYMQNIRLCGLLTLVRYKLKLLDPVFWFITVSNNFSYKPIILEIKVIKIHLFIPAKLNFFQSYRNIQRKMKIFLLAYKTPNPYASWDCVGNGTVRFRVPIDWVYSSHI